MEKFDVIAITETWLDMKEKIFNPEVEIEGYNFFSHGQSWQKRGRSGVLC